MAKVVLPKLPTRALFSAIDKLEKSWTGVVGVVKGFNLSISNEDMNDVIKIVKPLEKLGLLIDGAIETASYQIKKQEGGFVEVMMTHVASSLITLFTYPSLINQWLLYW